MADRELGLRKVAPIDAAPDNSTLDIIAIHGLGTESPRTWEYKKPGGGRVVNWLADADMLPAVIPEATIYTYDWNANYFKDAPVQTLLGHANTLLTLIASRASAGHRVIFVASCFGGLILAEAMTRAAQEDSPYRNILRLTVGIIFLATPFRGSDASRQAQWQVVVGGTMGEQSSTQLIEALNSNDRELRKLTISFAELARRPSINLPIYCFYETKETQLLRRFLPSGWVNGASAALGHITRKILVTEDSACLDTFERYGLDATHSGMNKFDGPDSMNFGQVKAIIRKFADDAESVIAWRRNTKPAAHFLVPYTSNPDFVGRADILEQLKIQLRQEQSSTGHRPQARACIYGLGGVGKTQIALEYVYWLQEIDPDTSVFWVNTSTAERFRESYASIAQECQLPGHADPETDVLLLVKKWLERKESGQWLMVVDNADDAQLCSQQPGGLRRHIPDCSHGSLLVTTRNKEAGVLLSRGRRLIEVREMNEGESKLLLQKKLEKDNLNLDELSNLSARMEQLPLALVQAAAFIQANTISVSAYLGLLDKSDQHLVDLLSEEFETDGRDSEARAVAETWILSFKQIQRQNPFASELLSLMSLFDRQAIPSEFLATYSQHQVEEDPSELQRTKALGVLKAFSFITETNYSFEMHRLVQLVTRKWLVKEGTIHHFASKALLTVSQCYPYGNHENRVVCGAYLAHAHAVLNIESTALQNEEVGKATLLLSVGAFVAYQGQWKEAEKLQHESMKLREKILGLEHPSTLTSIADLATTFWNQGRWTEAESLDLQVMETRKRVLGPEHPDTLSSIANLATTFRNQGRWTEAESLDLQVMETRKRVLGPEHPDTLSSIANLATTFWNQGRWTEAESLELQVMETSSRVLGPEHPDTLNSTANLAFTLQSQGRIKEAINIMEQCVRLQEEILGPAHPRTASNLSTLHQWHRRNSS